MLECYLNENFGCYLLPTYLRSNVIWNLESILLTTHLCTYDLQQYVVYRAVLEKGQKALDFPFSR